MSSFAKKIIGIDENSNDIFERDATPHRNPVHLVNPVKNSSKSAESLKTKLRSI